MIKITKKWHKDCGGIVKYQKPMYDTHFEEAGFCTKCEAFPLFVEEIIFEIDEQKVERFYDNKEWRIVDKNQIKEKLVA